MSSKRLDSISDFVRHGYDLRVDCRACGKITIMSAFELRDRLHRQRKSMQLDAVAARLRCTCGQKDVRVGPTGRMSR